jgi:hypothetical protein
MRFLIMHFRFSEVTVHHIQRTVPEHLTSILVCYGSAA